MSSTFKRRAKAYSRRGKQKAATQKQARNAKQQRTANLFQNVLGITSAVGYNKNVLETARLLSKRSASNYLTTLVHQSKFRAKLNEFFKDFNPMTESRLIYIVKKKDPFILQKYLSKQIFPTEQIDLNPTQNLYSTPPLIYIFGELAHLDEEYALYPSSRIPIQGRRWGHRVPTHSEIELKYAELIQSMNKLYKLVRILLNAGLDVKKDDILQMWRTSRESILVLLDENPILAVRSNEYQNKIRTLIERNVSMYSKDANDEEAEWVRDGEYSGYGYVSAHTKAMLTLWENIEGLFNELFPPETANGNQSPYS
jgi:hypothetical protein